MRLSRRRELRFMLVPWGWFSPSCLLGARGTDGVRRCSFASSREHLEGAGGCPTALPSTAVITVALEGVKMFPFCWDFQKRVTKLSNQLPRRKVNNGFCLLNLCWLRWEPE